MVLKEQLIGDRDPLADILYRLRSYPLPKRITLALFSNMSLKFCTIQMLSPHPDKLKEEKPS
jgi:hypothetical protein